MVVRNSIYQSHCWRTPTTESKHELDKRQLILTLNPAFTYGTLHLNQHSHSLFSHLSTTFRDMQTRRTARKSIANRCSEALCEAGGP